jgi:hypothetical protein
MKQFIRKLLFFLTIPIVLCLAGLTYMQFQIQRTFQKYMHDSICTSLFVGDSHVQYAIDNTLLNNANTIANTGESFYFTYYKLKTVIEANDQIKKVYLGLSYHSLSNYYERFIWGEYSEAIAKKYYFLLPFSEQVQMFYWNRSHVFVFLKTVIQQGIEQLNMNYTFAGKFQNEFKNTIAVKTSEDKRLKFQFFKENGEPNEFSAFNLEYLNKIIDLCAENKIKLYFLNTPLHAYYQKQIPEVYKQKLNQIVATKQIGLVDLSNFQLSDSCFIPDGDHVSLKGAVKTSIEMKRLMETAAE